MAVLCLYENAPHTHTHYRVHSEQERERERTKKKNRKIDYNEGLIDKGWQVNEQSEARR